jgi:hypothetical protein
MQAVELIEGVAAAHLHSAMILYMDASRLPRAIWVCAGTDRLQFYIRPVDAGGTLLALMESADPRLISPKDSKPRATYRLGGSRSDLFAITLLSTLRNLYGGHSFLKVVDTRVVCHPYAG